MPLWNSMPHVSYNVVGVNLTEPDPLPNHVGQQVLG